MTKDVIITHIDLMIDFVRNYTFHPDDLSTWEGDMRLMFPRCRWTQLRRQREELSGRYVTFDEGAYLKCLFAAVP